MWIRYDLRTRRELHRSTVPFSAPLEGAGDVEISESAVKGPFGLCRLAADGAHLEVDTVRALAVAWDAVRARRNALLVASDGLLLRAWEIGSEDDVRAWKAYRQALRDLPQTQPDPTSIAWPAQPV